MKTLRNRTYTFVNFYYRSLKGEVEEMRDLLEEEVGRPEPRVPRPAIREDL
jgi:hypothetical protein